MKILHKLKKSNGAATNSILLTFVQVITTILGLVVTKLLSTHFSLQEYGTYSQALLVTTTVTSISILGLTNATNFFYNRTTDKDEQCMYVSTIFSLQYIVGITCAFILIFFRTMVASYFDNNRLIRILPIVAFTPFLTNLISMYQTLFVSIGKAKVIAARNFAVSVIRLFAVIISCFVLNNIVTVLMVIFCLDMAQVIYFYLLFSKYKYPISVKNCRFNLTKEILAFSIPMSIYVLTNSLSRDIDKYVVSAFSNTETLAIYTNAAKLLPFDLLTASLITVLIPIITRTINHGNYDDARDIFKLYLRIGYVLTFIFVGGAIAVSEDLMCFLYDEKYLAGLPIFVIYLFVDMIRFANVTTILSGSGKTKILMMISVVTMFCNLIFNIIGYKAMGLIGPAIVTLILTASMTFALLYFGAREIKSRVTELFDFKEMSIIIVEIVIIGCGTHYLNVMLCNYISSRFVRLVLCYGLYMMIMMMLNYKRAVSCYQRLNSYK